MASVIVASAAISVGCKGKTIEKDSAETLSKLADYERSIADKDKLIKQLSAQVDDLDDGVVIKMEAPQKDGSPGAIVEIVGRGPNAKAAGSSSSGAPTKADEEVYAAFVAKVGGSMGGVRKCYETALKKNSKLQRKPVMLTITVKYFTTGRVAGVNFSPPISPDFDRCVKAIAKNWTLSRLPNAISVNYRTRLKPQL